MFSRRAAHTVLPLASAAIVANGLQGTYLHLRGVAQRPGGITALQPRSRAAGVRAAARLAGRRDGVARGGPASRGRPPQAIAGSADAVPQPAPARGHPATSRSLSRLRRPRQRRRVGRRHGRASCWPAWRCPVSFAFFTPAEVAIAAPLLDLLLAQDGEPRVPVLGLIDSRLAIGETDGWHYDDMPEDGQAWRDTLALSRRGRRDDHSRSAASPL